MTQAWRVRIQSLLSTVSPLSKYGEAELKTRLLPSMLQRDDSVWQGATWMTEVKGGSDLGRGGGNRGATEWE